MLIHQKRGKGTPAFKSPSHRFVADVRYPQLVYSRTGLAQVIGLEDDPGRNALLARISFEDGNWFYSPAAEGLAVGDKIAVGTGRPSPGAILSLGEVPDGTPVFNLELSAGDGGKAARSSGAVCYVVSHDEDTGMVSVQLASKKVVVLSPRCLATVGVACGGERTEKPFMKAGEKRHAMEARNKYYPKVRGTAMNAYDHPHGGKGFGTPTTRARGSPHGAKVGLIAARQSGRKKTRRSVQPASG